MQGFCLSHFLLYTQCMEYGLAHNRYSTIICIMAILDRQHKNTECISRNSKYLVSAEVQVKKIWREIWSIWVGLENKEI